MSNLFYGLFVIFILCACGIKGPPMPPHRQNQVAPVEQKISSPVEVETTKKDKKNDKK